MPPLPEGEERARACSAGCTRWPASHVDVALKHPMLIANALGSPPKDVIEQAHAGRRQGRRAGRAAKHAQRHVDNGVDIIVAQGYEAGGHTGEIAAMVLTPEIVDAVGGRRARARRRRHRHAAGRSRRRWRSARRACGRARSG